MSGAGEALMNMFGGGSSPGGQANAQAQQQAQMSPVTPQQQPAVQRALSSNPGLTGIDPSMVTGMSGPDLGSGGASASSAPIGTGSSPGGAPSGVNQQVYNWAIAQGMDPQSAAMMALSSGQQSGALTKTAEGLMPVAMLLLKERLERGQGGTALPRHENANTQQPNEPGVQAQPSPQEAMSGASIVAELL